MTCDGNVHAANSIASTHERTPVSVFTEEGVSGGRGAPEHSGDDDGLFADLLNSGGDAFAGLPEMDGGAGFLVDDPNDPNEPDGGDAKTAVLKHENDVEAMRGRPSPHRESSPRDAPERPGRDSAGSAAGRAAHGESSAGAAGSGSHSHSDASHSHSHSHVRGDETKGSLSMHGATEMRVSTLERGSGGHGSGGSFGLTMDDYASLERVGASGMEDFLGPIMDDHAGVGFDDDTNAATWNPRGMHRGPSPGAFAPGANAGAASDAAYAQARAQADARARAMQHARAQGMGAPVGGMGVGPGSMGPGSMGQGSMGGMPGGGMGAEPGIGGVGRPMPGGPVSGAPRAAPPGTHGMPTPPFGVGPPGAPPVRGPGGVMYFPGPPLPMLHLTNGASDAPPSRLERLRRWKEKRKNRNFNKTIRYQSRKVCADNRPRIKGKFVKVGSTPDLGAMDDLGADFERARTAGAPGSSLGDVPENEESAEDSMGSGGPPPEGRLARVAGLRRGGGLTNSMSVPAGLAMMGAKEEST